MLPLLLSPPRPIARKGDARESGSTHNKLVGFKHFFFPLRELLYDEHVKKQKKKEQTPTDIHLSKQDEALV